MIIVDMCKSSEGVTSERNKQVRNDPDRFNMFSWIIDAVFEASDPSVSSTTENPAGRRASLSTLRKSVWSTLFLDFDRILIALSP